MKIQAPKRISVGDFEEDDRASANVLAGILNNFMEEVYTAISGKLNIADNLNQAIKIIKVKLTSGVPQTPISFRNPIQGKINGLDVKRAIGNAFPTSGPFITFTESDSIVTINHITGLPDDIEYQLIIHIMGD